MADKAPDRDKNESIEDRKSELTEIQYRVTQEGATETPFRNAYWDNKEAGIYVDVVSGEPLFCSKDKFDSGTGWPSFSKPLEEENIATRKDKSLLTVRTEVLSREGDSHLGHLFDDGPPPTGQRYCINSAALRFIPAEKLKQAGYGRYSHLFSDEESIEQTASADSQATEQEKNQGIAFFAAGCFWGVEEILRKIDGVKEITVGYMGGTTANPSYKEVCTGKTGHAEAVKVVYDPDTVSYEKLLDYFFRLHDPTTLNRQGNDRGSQYRSAIFYNNDEQRKHAERKKAGVDQSGRWKNPVVTEIVPATPFYPAEAYHQDYLQKHPDGYSCHYLRD